VAGGLASYFKDRVPSLSRVFLGVKLSLVVELRRGASRLGLIEALTRSTLSTLMGKARLGMSEENAKMSIMISL
jgi:uncharacterized membrane protein (UPF0136 family)